MREGRRGEDTGTASKLVILHKAMAQCLADASDAKCFSYSLAGVRFATRRDLAVPLPIGNCVLVESGCDRKVTAAPTN